MEIFAENEFVRYMHPLLSEEKFDHQCAITGKRCEIGCTVR